MIEAGTNKLRIVNDSGYCTAYAYRSKPGNQWCIEQRNTKGDFKIVARVSGSQPEARQRRMVVAIMKELDR
jgi:hypothetical protein